MWEKKIEVTPPYDFRRVLERLSLDPLHTMNLKEQSVNIPLYIHEQPIVANVKAIGTKTNPKFIVSSETQDFQEEVLKRITHIFQWDVPLHTIHSHFLQTDMNPIFTEHEGTPLVLDFDPYHCLMKCIIHQQLNMAFAITLTQRFVEKFGQKINDTWFYPRPEKVAKLSVSDLRELQFSNRKAEYVIDTSKLLAASELDLDALEKMSDDEVVKTLVRIRGIGPWTAQNYLLFALGRQNLFPIADIGIQNAIKKLHNLDKKPTYEQMEVFSKDWKPFLSYASLYLWRSVE